MVDVVGVLTDSADPKQYIKKMRSRDPELNAKWGTICTPVAMLAPDGKKRKTQAADTQGIFPLIQSIPSPRAEPFKQWLAQVSAERPDEMQDPELTIDRAMMEYKQLGYSDHWINQRLKSIEVRKELTEEWKRRGMEEGGNSPCSPTLSLRRCRRHTVMAAGRPAKDATRQLTRQFDQHGTDPEYVGGSFN